MKFPLIVTTGVLALSIVSGQAKESIIMTVDGRKVPTSEFQYLYNKNNQQQGNKQNLDEYIELFKIYKLKVADAIRNGIDTTESFKKEMAQYRRELAAPYLIDSLFINSLIDDAFQRGAVDIEASHIMLYKTKDENINKSNIQLLDSIRKQIIAGEDFGNMAFLYSQDRAAKMNRGNMGFVPSGKLPYNFETALYNLKEGEISDIVESPVGYHLIKAGKRKPAKGKVVVSHIMKMVPPNSNDTISVNLKNQIDSLYLIVKNNPEAFFEIAKTNSDDKASARNNGLLPEFGTGEMVPEFEAVSFSLKDGEISAPFRSQYGWHIVKKLSHKDTIPYEEIKAKVLSQINNPQDERYLLVKNHEIQQLENKFNASFDEELLIQIKENIIFNDNDSVYELNLSSKDILEAPIYSVNGKSHKSSELLSKFKNFRIKDKNQLSEIVKNTIKSSYQEELKKAEEEWLYENETEYRNLLNEYSDGSLLYEISLEKVWDKASKDEEGLNNFFEKYQKNYSFKEPHAKGILVNTGSDSLANVIRNRMTNLSEDSIVPTIKKEFAGKVYIEKILIPKGINKLVDNLMFGATNEIPKGPNNGSFFIFNGRIITEPEELSDVRGQVTGDYQKELEMEWVEELKKVYPIKINKGEIKKLE